MHSQFQLTIFFFKKNLFAKSVLYELLLFSFHATDFNEELKRPEVISKIDSSYSGGSVSKPVDDGEDGAENGTSLVDAAASPSSMCKRDNIAGTHVPYSERLRYLLF